MSVYSNYFTNDDWDEHFKQPSFKIFRCICIICSEASFRFSNSVLSFSDGKSTMLLSFFVCLSGRFLSFSEGFILEIIVPWGRDRSSERKTFFLVKTSTSYRKNGSYCLFSIQCISNACKFCNGKPYNLLGVYVLHHQSTSFHCQGQL